jgi:ABC-type multidrug transport system fused ATPase/permease subunit
MSNHLPEALTVQKLDQNVVFAQISSLKLLFLLFGELSRSRRRNFLPLILLMLLGAFAELVTLGALLPILSLISAPESSPILDSIRPYLKYFGSNTLTREVMILTGLFTATVFFATVTRILLLRLSQDFVYGISQEIGVKLFRDTLAQPYSYHVQHNTSELIASISKAELVTSEVLMPLMSAFVSIVTALFLVGGLIAIDFRIALIAGGGFIIVYLLTSILTRSHLRKNGFIIASAHETRIQAMQEGLGGIRDIIIDRSQDAFVEIYRIAESRLREARSRNAIFSNAPRLIVEGSAMVLIVVVSVNVMYQPGGFSSAIPALGALALGAQKLLPLVQQTYLGWAKATGNRQSLIDIVTLINRANSQDEKQESQLTFRQSISLHKIGFSYPGIISPILSEVSFAIPKGTRVGIVGRTGSGKSTLVDIILGLLVPTEGKVFVDGQELNDSITSSWQRNIAHVPQSIFLTDRSISENIAFGVKKEDIDMVRVRLAADQAELSAMIAALPNSYDTRVGERGIQLSGGQRQRIGIARALYKNACVLVFDEATSALDNETEYAVMKSIHHISRDITVLIIAHRLSTLKNCDLIVALKNGRVECLSQEEFKSRMLGSQDHFD